MKHDCKILFDSNNEKTQTLIAQAQEAISLRKAPGIPDKKYEFYAQNQTYIRCDEVGFGWVDAKRNVWSPTGVDINSTYTTNHWSASPAKSHVKAHWDKFDDKTKVHINIYPAKP